MADASAEFDEFVAAKAHALLRVAYLLAGDQHLAEDHLQEALERVYMRWDQIRDSPESYARKVLVNRSIDYWRWRRRRPEVPLARETGVVADRTADVLGRRAVLDALSGLTERQRAIVVLRYLDELPVAEVAALLGCSEGAVQSQTARGLAKLRQSLPNVTYALNGEIL